MAVADKNINSYMLSVSELSLQQLQSRGFEKELSDVGNRLQMVLDTTPGRQRIDALKDKGSHDGKAAIQAATRPRPRRRRQQATAVPTRGEISTGWSDLLGEISSSSRRVRVAKGGHFGAKESGHKRPSSTTEGPGQTPVSANEVLVVEDSPQGEDVGEEEMVEASADCDNDPEGSGAGMPDALPVASACTPATSSLGAVAAPPTLASGSHAPQSTLHPAEPVAEADEAMSWRSYRIDEQKVPDMVLGAIWRRAVDPKHCTEEVDALARVPRMTVTKREVLQLPAVHDMQYWRTVKTKRREEKKAFEESETFPPLAEMMQTIFGVATPPQSHVQGLHKQMEEMYTVEKARCSVTGFVAKSVLAKDATNEEEFETEASATLQAASDMEKEETAAMQATKTKTFLGVRQKGRRNAFDEGQPWQRGNQPLAEMDEKAEEQRLTNSRVSRVLLAAQAAQFDDAHAERLDNAHHKVNERCQKKVVRIHDKFVLKQGQLSARLTRRVQRLRMDFQETQDTKVSSILPSVVAWDGSQGSRSARSSASSGGGGKGGETVLQYLQRHRYRAEQERQSHHAIYLQQVERFQSYLKLLADPNRLPERGELYLSECFRHVLAAGLIIDNAFFFRVLHSLDAEDFEKTSTVNLLAACCVSFNIDLRQYWAHLRHRGLSENQGGLKQAGQQAPRFLTPRPKTNDAKVWEDWAPWNGVRLEEVVPMPPIVAASSSGNTAQKEESEGLDDSIKFIEDPCPFVPIVPEDTPSASDFAARAGTDPLLQILQQVSLDMVLERYQIRRPDWKPQEAGVEERHGEESALHSEVALGGRRSPSTPGAPRKAAAAPSTPSSAAGKPRPGARKHLSTLQRTRGIAEPMGEMPNAPDKDRPRAAAQLPAMTPIAERPMLE